MIGLDLALTLAATKLEVCSDSQIIVGQIQKEHEAKDKRMAHYLTLVEDCLGRLGEWAVRHVPWIENLKANALVRIAAILSIRETVMLPVHLQAISSVALVVVYNIVEADPGWMHKIVKYLQMGDLLRDEKNAHKVRVQSPASP